MKKTGKIITTLAITTMVVSFAFVGCGTTDTTGETTTTQMPGTDTTGDTLGTDMENGIDKVGDAVGDVVDGVGNGAEDMVDGGFSNYNDAHDYLFGRLQKQNTNAKYEVRNESKDVMDYDTGKKGYRFQIYDTSGSKDVNLGEFYVDSKDGRIHKMNDKTKKVEAYSFK